MMTFEQILTSLLQTVQTQVQIPTNLQWVPLVAAAAVLIGGLITVLRGARWAPGMMALAFLAAGGTGGYFLAGQIATPQWLTAGIVGLIAGVLGIALFRLWQAALLGGVAMGVALGIFTVMSLTPHLESWNADPAPDDIVVALKPAGSVVDQQPTVRQQLGSLWTHLDTNVPSFQMKIWSVLGSSGIAGLIFGLLLPRASRALWVATVGTLAIGSGAAGLMQQFAPAQLDWLIANPQWGWVTVGIIWVAAFIFSFASAKPKPKLKADATPTARPALA